MADDSDDEMPPDIEPLYNYKTETKGNKLILVETNTSTNKESRLQLNIGDCIQFTRTPNISDETISAKIIGFLISKDEIIGIQYLPWNPQNQQYANSTVPPRAILLNNLNLLTIKLDNKLQNIENQLKEPELKETIGPQIDFGTSKTAYTVGKKTNFFKNWPQNKKLSELCIVKMKDNEENLEDIKIHKDFADYGFAPIIYDETIFNREIYMLEDKCGTRIDKYIKDNIKPDGDKYFFPDYIFNKIIDLFHFIINDMAVIQLDAKPGNTCSIFENDIFKKIIALDFNSFHYYDSYNMDKKEAFLFMLIQFLYVASKFSKIFATPEQLEQHLKYDDVVKIIKNLFLIDKSKFYGYYLLHYIKYDNPIEMLTQEQYVEDIYKHIGLQKYKLNEIDGGNLKKHKSGKRKSRKRGPKKSKKCSYRRRTKERYKRSKIKKP